MASHPPAWALRAILAAFPAGTTRYSCWRRRVSDFCLTHRRPSPDFEGSSPGRAPASVNGGPGIGVGVGARLSNTAAAFAFAESAAPPSVRLLSVCATGLAGAGAGPGKSVAFVTSFAEASAGCDFGAAVSSPGTSAGWAVDFGGPSGVGAFATVATGRIGSSAPAGLGAGIGSVEAVSVGPVSPPELLSAEVPGLPALGLSAGLTSASFAGAGAGLSPGSGVVAAPAPEGGSLGVEALAVCWFLAEELEALPPMALAGGSWLALPGRTWVYQMPPRIRNEAPAASELRDAGGSRPEG